MMREYIVLKTVVKGMIPFIQLFALYVLAHGELGPGGGFQGGVIFSASIILYVLVFGLAEGKKRFSSGLSDSLSSLGVLIYAGVGILCLLAGGAFLQYASLIPEDHKLASSLGIYGIEIGVFITVAAVMITIFYEAARHDD